MKIAFIHPDLGIGGAERLVIDAALGLQDKGHKVAIYTSYRDYNHCFEEARDGTLDVRVRGDTIIPAHFSGRFSILCAMLRQIHLAMTLLMDEDDFDVIFIDQLSAAIPILQYNLKAKIVFYCHFPDKLLSSRQSLLKKLYRLPFDMIEGATTGAADTILVNSKFTASIFAESFPRIEKRPQVLYPCVMADGVAETGALEQTPRKLILSLNRFERKKDVGLAIRAFSKLKRSNASSKAVLIVAGGHDARVTENVTTLNELRELCDSLSISHGTLHPPYSLPVALPSGQEDVDVIFMLSVPAALKSSLLAKASLLAYTPANEHFGIVPLEAMLASTLVLAQNSGGPLETVQDGITGFSRPADADVWSEVMAKALQPDVHEQEMEKRARQVVLEKFGQEKFITDLEDVLKTTMALPPPRPKPLLSLKAVALLVLLFILGVVCFTYLVLIPLEMKERAEMNLEARSTKHG